MEIVILILALVLWFVVRPFLKDWKKSDQKIMSEGGIRRKYAKLIDILLDSEPRMKIYREDVSSATLGFTYAGGYNKFQLIHGFDGISIIYTNENNIYGKYQLKWDFDESKNQEDMATIIFTDMQKKNERLFNKEP